MGLLTFAHVKVVKVLLRSVKEKLYFHIVYLNNWRNLCHYFI